MSRQHKVIAEGVIDHTSDPILGLRLATLRNHHALTLEMVTDHERDALHGTGPADPRRELPVLVLFQGWNSFFPDQVEPRRRTMAVALHERLVRQLLPEFLPAQRWFAGKGRRIERVDFERHDLWPDRQEWLLARIRVWLEGRSEPQDYSLPLALAWGDASEEKMRPMLPYALAKVRMRSRMGLLYGAFVDEGFCQHWVAMMAHGTQIPVGGGRLRAFAPPVLANWQALPRKHCPPSAWRRTAATPALPSVSAC